MIEAPQNIIIRIDGDHLATTAGNDRSITNNLLGAGGTGNFNLGGFVAQDIIGSSTFTVDDAGNPFNVIATEVPVLTITTANATLAFEEDLILYDDLQVGGEVTLDGVLYTATGAIELSGRITENTLATNSLLRKEGSGTLLLERAINASSNAFDSLVIAANSGAVTVTGSGALGDGTNVSTASDLTLNQAETLGDFTISGGSISLGGATSTTNLTISDATVVVALGVNVLSATAADILATFTANVGGTLSVGATGGVIQAGTQFQNTGGDSIIVRSEGALTFRDIDNVVSVRSVLNNSGSFILEGNEGTAVGAIDSAVLTLVTGNSPNVGELSVLSVGSVITLGGGTNTTDVQLTLSGEANHDPSIVISSSSELVIGADDLTVDGLTAKFRRYVRPKWKYYNH